MSIRAAQRVILRMTAFGVTGALALLAAGCSSGDESPISTESMASTLSAGASIPGEAAADSSKKRAASDSSDCSAFKDYGTFDVGTQVVIRGAVRGAEADLLSGSLTQFTNCTGIDVSYIGNDDFATGIIVRAQAEDPPDLAIFPQPALFGDMASAGYLVPAPGGVVDNIHEFWSDYWQKAGIVDDKVYGAPLTASVKGYVWYSPKEFEANGYTVPKTLDELTALTDTIAKAGKHKPWCEGFASGDASGWPGTDWVEDMVLRQSGPATYDRWVSHAILFNAPPIERAMNSVGALIKNSANVNGGHGDVASVATTEFETAGLPVLEGKCSLYHQASFYEGFWATTDGDAVNVAEDGDVWAFMLPGVKANDHSVIVGGDLVGAFNDESATQAVQKFLSSDTWANTRVSLGGVISANSGVDADNASSPLLSASIRMLQHPSTTLRFDASDVMPSAVGTGSFWSGMLDWINGEATTVTLNAIEITWPQTSREPEGKG